MTHFERPGAKKSDRKLDFSASGLSYMLIKRWCHPATVHVRLNTAQMAPKRAARARRAARKAALTAVKTARYLPGLAPREAL